MQNLKHSVRNKIILIGASTGGPGQIEKIINEIPKLNNTSIIIAQHMAIGFMSSFAKRLQEYSANPISIAEDGEILVMNHVYVCCGYTTVYKNNLNIFFSQSASPSNNFNPDINVLFKSLIPLSDEIEIMSVILTGIGADGVDACKILSQKGAVCVTESSESAIVDGMPARARQEVENILVQEIDEIAQTIKGFCK